MIVTLKCFPGNKCLSSNPQPSSVARVLTDLMPDLKKLVMCPARALYDDPRFMSYCPEKNSSDPHGYIRSDRAYWLYVIVIHLNDDHEWPRERVADWLESLDDVDLSFQTRSEE